MLFVEAPSYRDTSVCHPVKVNFCVINGKRKRSQPQHFTYTPLAGTKAAPPVEVVIIKVRPASCQHSQPSLWFSHSSIH